MQNLLEMFRQQEHSFSKLGVRDLHKLKYVYDSATRETNYADMQFELKTVFKLIEALDPTQMKVQIDEAYKKIEKLEFNPTVSGSNIVFRDKIRRDFSVWYKPTVYIPTQNSAIPLTPDFLISKGVHPALFDIDDTLRKQLYNFEFFSNAQLREISIKLLGKIKPVHAIMMCKRKFAKEDAPVFKTIDYYLKPRKLLIVSEDYLPEEIKNSLPMSADYVENLDAGCQKLKDLAPRAI